jgi:hypothetical protein
MFCFQAYQNNVGQNTCAEPNVMCEVFQIVASSIKFFDDVLLHERFNLKLFKEIIGVLGKVQVRILCEPIY